MLLAMFAVKASPDQTIVEGVHILVLKTRSDVNIEGMKYEVLDSYAEEIYSEASAAQDCLEEK